MNTFNGPELILVIALALAWVAHLWPALVETDAEEDETDA